jgi:hypothetical protein
MLESALRQKIIKKLREKYGSDIWLFHPHGDPMSMAGVPDIIGVLRGQFFGFEVKRTAKLDATALQSYTLRKITKAGGVTSVISSFEEAEILLDRVK